MSYSATPTTAYDFETHHKALEALRSGIDLVDRALGYFELHDGVENDVVNEMYRASNDLDHGYSAICDALNSDENEGEDE